MLKRLIVSVAQTNCYILYFENKDCFIIDPGDNFKKISSYIEQQQLNVKAILITHGHFDHIGAVDDLAHNYHCDVYTHLYSKELLEDSDLNLSSAFGKPFVVKSSIQYVKDEVSINNYKFKFILTEGHCVGCSMIYYKDESLLFSGDMLFRGSIGRYDFPTSNHQQMKASIDFIKTFDFDATILPGHGESSTLALEFETNPYFL